MGRYTWSRLNKHQVGRFAEYFVKMEFALYGFEVFTSEVDDRGIDVIVRHNDTGFLEIQVKSARGNGYVFMQKSKFPLKRERFLALVLLDEDAAPDLFLIRATEWETPNDLLCGYDYEGLKSVPEWGLRLSNRNRPHLMQFQFANTLAKLIGTDT